ncbi:hypothetical protein BV509_17685 [Rhodovulum sulfidophilum]|uniref:Uncharacterized protein n=1 Tax=Rhodovulum visakhapatnamense TaxID=364297 RepID=A0ABS1RLT0_9RHOB|nr:hypothetical protein [Rhodovulum visakhapatnamense]MBL3571820.1 hypothetical protein [Rhodovulum visakhapatnamense]MBL3580599.1 hypothetical protein [Rhodovulum visakhapatnamense]OLS46006.1 hypothetical protein BV509_17685 [Rhodovulum sulfidophilum]
MQERAMMLDRQMQRQGQRNSPIRRAMPVRAALEWAFGTECARLDHDEIGAVGGTGWRSYGMEYVALERAQLGTRVDTSRGRSTPHDDAELIATVVRNTLPWYAATLVADLARAGRTPDWMPDARPRLRPAEWQHNRPGLWAKSRDSSETPDGWKPIPRRNRKGVIVHDAVRFTPCHWAPTPARIAAARRAYLDWWGYLLAVQAALKAANLARIEVTENMPPMRPWG